MYDVANPIDMRAFFEKRNNRWVLTFLCGGD